MTVLRFDNVSKQYPGGHVALSEVSFAVAPGEMLFVTGHSGAGKSTLLKLIQLAERPSRGAVLFGEKNLAKVRGGKVALHRRSVGVVYQNHQLLMDRSVGENVALPLILRGMKRGEIGKRVRYMLERLGLAARERALPSQLSAGEQQRVGIARAPAPQQAAIEAGPEGERAPRKRRRRRGGRRIEGGDALSMPANGAPAPAQAPADVRPSLLSRIGKGLKSLVTRAPRSQH